MEQKKREKTVSIDVEGLTLSMSADKIYMEIQTKDKIYLFRIDKKVMKDITRVLTFVFRDTSSPVTKN